MTPGFIFGKFQTQKMKQNYCSERNLYVLQRLNNPRNNPICKFELGTNFHFPFLHSSYN